MTLSSNRKNAIGILVISVLCVILYFAGDCTREKVRKNGVWVIMTIDNAGAASKGGMDISFHFHYNYKKFIGGVNMGGVNENYIGRRLFIMISIDNPNNQLIGQYLVPTWFTLDSPPEGWKQKPTESEMREMMVQDSIKRGLK